MAARLPRVSQRRTTYRRRSMRTGAPGTAMPRLRCSFPHLGRGRAIGGPTDLHAIRDGLVKAMSLSLQLRQLDLVIQKQANR